MEHTVVITDESARLAAALASCPPDAPVPTCPGWTASDLLWHLTKVHSFWAAVLDGDVRTNEQVQAVEAAAPQRPETLAEMLPMREAATAALVAALTALPDDAPRWSWWPADQSVGFTRRMQAAEALVHRIDAELTEGLTPTPVSPEEAAAAIVHALDVMHAFVPDGAEVQPVGILALETTDTGDRRLVELVRWSGTVPWTGEPGTGVAVRRTDADGPTATARGDLDDLLRWVWGRPGDVTLTGDDPTLAAVRTMLAAGIG